MKGFKDVLTEKIKKNYKDLNANTDKKYDL